MVSEILYYYIIFGAGRPGAGVSGGGWTPAGWGG